MSIITVTTPFNIDLEFRIAPFHKRLLAWLIDFILVYLYVILMYRYVISKISFGDEWDTVSAILLIYIPAFVYHIVCEVFLNGQSAGKKVLGIKVMDKTGREATVSQYLLRWLLRLVDMGITLGFGAVLSAALSKYTQRIGDLAAGTVVIDAKNQTNIQDTIYLEMEEETYKARFPEVLKLSDRDINGIRNLLASKSGNHDNFIYMTQVAQRIKDVLSIQSDLDPRSFLEQMLMDYNFMTRK